MHPGDTVQPGQDSDVPKNIDSSEKEVHDGSQYADNPPVAPVDNYADNRFAAGGAGPEAGGEIISWRSVEYMSHDKSPVWYIFLAALAAALTAVTYFITEDYISAGAIAAVAIIFGISAHRKPRTIDFAIAEHGVRIGNRQYPYGSFKSFSVNPEGDSRAVLLIPLKRFMPPVSMNYPPEKEDQIASALAQFLPFEQRDLDPVEHLMRRIRF